MLKNTSIQSCCLADFLTEKMFVLLILISVAYSTGLTTLFSILFTLAKNAYNSLNNLKNLSQNFFFKFLVISVLLMFAGIPPFFLFFLKSIFFLIFLKKNFTLVLFFLIVNLSAMYFYLQVARLLINIVTKNIFITSVPNVAFSFNFYFFLECTFLWMLLGFFFTLHMWVSLLYGFI